ncbi:MAG: hypothetical protein IKP07_01860 [Bacilli bacterium]|nr:hypothetical protein [Bacilli bacterium]
MKKYKKNKGLFINFFKSHKYIAMLLILIVSGVVINFGVRYSVYAYNVLRVYYLRTQNFYFNSNKLTLTGKTYEISPWPATTDQTIDITMNSKDNSLKMTTTDITYDVEVSCHDNYGDNVTRVNCYLKENDSDTSRRTKLEGMEIVYDEDLANTNTDSFKVVVEPVNAGEYLITGNRITVEVEARATAPYTQTLRGTFVIIVGDYGIEYKIKDQRSQLYLDSIITNTLDYSTYFRMDFPINVLTFDMSNMIYNNCTKIDNVTTGVDCAYRVSQKTVDGTNYDYISGIDFKLNAKSSMLVRFYKNGSNVNSDFSFEVGGNNSSIITYCKLDTDDTTKITRTTTCET